MKIIAIDIGLSKSATGFSIMDTLMDDVTCEELNTVNSGLAIWGAKIIRKLNEVHEDGAIDYIAVEQNFGSNRRVSTTLNCAIGIIHGWAVMNGATFVTINPAKITKYIGEVIRFKGVLRREQRKDVLKRFFDLKMENNKKLSYSQDLIDSFCVCHYIRDEYYPRV